MKRAGKFLQAYRNTPWRRQSQLLGGLAALAVGASIVGILYVWVTSQAGTYGLQVQQYQATAKAVEQSIEDKKVQLADLTSSKNLSARAEEANYVPVDSNRVRYLEIEGYAGEQPLQLAPPPNSGHFQDIGGRLPEKYTTSLMDWVRQMLYTINNPEPGE